MTIANIAEKLNINKSTVSRALRGRSGVHPDTRERCIRLAGELGYPIPKDADTHNVALILPAKSVDEVHELAHRSMIAISSEITRIDWQVSFVVVPMKAASEAGPSKVYGEMSFFRYDPQTHWWQNVNDYVNAKLLWNPDLDCDELLKQYFSDLYGPAAKEMGEFHDLLEKNYMTCSDSAYLPRETVEKLSTLLDSAEQKTANTEFAGRVEYVRSNFIALKKYEEMYHAQAAPGEVGTKNILWRSPGETRFDGTKNAKVLEKPVTPGLEYTLEAWISPDDLTSRPVLYGESFNTFEPYYIFGSTMQDPTFNHIGLAIVGNCLMLNDNNLGQVKSKPLKLEKGKYYHVAAVGSVAGSQLAIYLDGEPVGLQTVLGTIVNRKPTKEPAPILVYGGGGDQQSFRQIKGVRGVFNGKIKDAAIYDKALSPAEVLNRSKQK